MLQLMIVLKHKNLWKNYKGVKQAMCPFNFDDVLFQFFPILVSVVLRKFTI